MKIGIPLFKNRISPHFSTAPEMLVVTISTHAVYSTSRLNLSNLTLTEKKRKVIFLGIDTLICGGIDGKTKEWFIQKGIRVIENIMGEVEDILSDYLNSIGNSDSSSLIKSEENIEKMPSTKEINI